MSLIKWDPFKDISKFLDEDMFSMVPLPKGWDLATDIYEKDGNLIVETQLPGLDAKDLEIEVEDNYLKISGEKKEEKEEKKKNYYMKQMKSGKIAKTILLPKDVIGEKADATLEKGILKVIIPLKSQEKKTKKKIKIKTKNNNKL